MKYKKKKLKNDRFLTKNDRSFIKSYRFLKFSLLQKNYLTLLFFLYLLKFLTFKIPLSERPFPCYLYFNRVRPFCYGLLIPSRLRSVPVSSHCTQSVCLWHTSKLTFRPVLAQPCWLPFGGYGFAPSKVSFYFNFFIRLWSETDYFIFVCADSRTEQGKVLSDAVFY